MFSHKKQVSSSSKISSGGRTSSSTNPSNGRSSSSSNPGRSRPSSKRSSAAKKFTRGLSILVPSTDNEVNRRLCVLHSPKMGSSSPNPSIEQLESHPPYPLHPSVKDRLDPTYVAFYNQHIIDKQQVHLQPVAASRASGVLIPGGGQQMKVGRKEDIVIKRRETRGPDLQCRVFIPEGQPPHEGWPLPSQGWPLMVYYHGGGWVLGNLDTENTVCSQLCARSRCVVVTVDYRLGPEDPYPAAVHDSWEVLVYFLTSGIQAYHISPKQFAIGGSSAGGNLAAIMTHKLLAYNVTHPHAPFPLPKAQLLIVPVTDNTATIFNTPSWLENEHTPALPAAKMLWYRSHYLPDERSWGDPEASPLLYSEDADGVRGRWEKLPRALVVVGECDVLRDEGVKYAERLLRSGVNVQLKVMKGMPHPFLAMDDVLRQGRETIAFMVEMLKESFGSKGSEKWG